MKKGAAHLLILACPFLVGSPAAADLEEEERRLSGLALDLMVQAQERILRIADPIRLAATPFCESQVGPVLGLFAADQYSFADLFGRRDYAQPFIDAAALRFDLQRTPRVLVVRPGSPAAEAQLRPGDLVTEINGRKLKRSVRIDSLPRRAIDETSAQVRFRVERDGTSKELAVRGEIGCAFSAHFWYGPDINAFATRFGSLTGIYVFAGMLRFLPSDDDLAIIIGHELAHMILKHHGGPPSKRYEADADYVGLYLAARAGFDITGAPQLWDRFARKNPYSTIDWGVYRHPSSPERSLALRATLDEIAGKRERGEPLRPEER